LRRFVYYLFVSDKARITLLLGAMEDVFYSHIDSLTYILEIIDRASDDERLDMHWSLGWSLSRMQTSLQSASDALGKAMSRSGIKPPEIDLEMKPLDDPEEFIIAWSDHLALAAEKIHQCYSDLQSSLRGEDDFEKDGFSEDDDFWDLSLRNLLGS
jgi:hypothetical protein